MHPMKNSGSYELRQETAYSNQPENSPRPGQRPQAPSVNTYCTKELTQPPTWPEASRTCACSGHPWTWKLVCNHQLEEQEKGAEQEQAGMQGCPRTRRDLPCSRFLSAGHPVRSLPSRLSNKLSGSHLWPPVSF